MMHANGPWWVELKTTVQRGLNFRKHSCKRRGSVARVHGDCWRGFLPHEVDHGPGEDGAALQL